MLGRLIRRAGLPVAAAAWLAGCGDLKSPTEPDGAVPVLSFRDIQTQVFTPSCALAGCHDTATAQGDLDLSAGRAHGALVGRPSSATGILRVEPGAPERSYLLHKLRGDPGIAGDRMPQGGPFLTASRIEGIAGWIRRGARETD